MLNDQQILDGIKDGSIVIKPFDQSNLGSNSYDVHLGETLAVYKDCVIDSKKHNEIEYVKIPEEGIVLYPGQFYLGVTQEYTETHQHVAFLDGKSSTGRLGLMVHHTAGRGDVGFCNHWTLEISCLKPVRIYSGMPIAQLFYFEIDSFQDVVIVWIILEVNIFELYLAGYWLLEHL